MVGSLVGEGTMHRISRTRMQVRADFTLCRETRYFGQVRYFSAESQCESRTLTFSFSRLEG